MTVSFPEYWIIWITIVTCGVSKSDPKNRLLLKKRKLSFVISEDRGLITMSIDIKLKSEFEGENTSDFWPSLRVTLWQCAMYLPSYALK